LEGQVVYSGTVTYPQFGIGRRRLPQETLDVERAFRNCGEESGTNSVSAGSRTLIPLSPEKSGFLIADNLGYAGKLRP